MPRNSFHKSTLASGGSAAVLTSTCCAEPWVLVAPGVSSAWIGNLTLLEPCRPAFIDATLVAWFFAGRRIFRPTAVTNATQYVGYPPSVRSVTNA